MVDGRFFGHFIWKVVGSCAHTRESRTATVHGELTCGGGGNIRIHVYLQLPYTVYSRVVVGAIYAYMCTYSYRTRCTHMWWWGQYTHTCVPTATVHGAPYTVYSCVVVGAIYAYMCTYSYCTRCTHVWWLGQYTHTCVPTATVHGVPNMVNSRVLVGAIYAYMCTYSYHTRCTVHSVPYTVYRTR